MKKEIFIAIIIGSIIGGIVTYGVYKANKALLNKATGNNPQLANIPTPTPIAETNIYLAISEPKSNIAVNQENIIIKGKSLENAIISIISDNEENIIEADEQGLFSYELALSKGANTIKITASDGNKLSQEEIINIVYSTQIEDIEE